MVQQQAEHYGCGQIAGEGIWPRFSMKKKVQWIIIMKAFSGFGQLLEATKKSWLICFEMLRKTNGRAKIDAETKQE